MQKGMGKEINGKPLTEKSYQAFKRCLLLYRGFTDKGSNDTGSNDKGSNDTGSNDKGSKARQRVKRQRVKRHRVKKCDKGANFLKF